jgi:hypothetical protein
LALAVAAVLLSGCSSDSAFPAVHDMPTARTETKLTPDEVKQATDDLISARDRTEAKAGSAQPVAATSAPATTGRWLIPIRSGAGVRFNWIGPAHSPSNMRERESAKLRVWLCKMPAWLVLRLCVAARRTPNVDDDRHGAATFWEWAPPRYFFFAGENFRTYVQTDRRDEEEDHRSSPRDAAHLEHGNGRLGSLWRVPGRLQRSPRTNRRLKALGFLKQRKNSLKRVREGGGRGQPDFSKQCKRK